MLDLVSPQTDQERSTAVATPDGAGTPPRAALGGDQTFGRTISALRRHAWLVLLLTVLAGIAGMGLSRFFRPYYLARTTIWIDEAGHRAARPSVAGANLFDPQGWINLLRSNTVLDSVVTAHRLFLIMPRYADTSVFAGLAATPAVRPGRYELAVDRSDGRLTVTDADGHVLERAAAGDSLGSSLGLMWKLPSDIGGLADAGSYTFTLQRPEAVSARIAKALQVSINPQGSLLTIALSGGTARGTAEILESIARRYVAVTTTLQRQRLVERRDALAQQRRAASRALRSAERELETFRVGTVTSTSASVTGAATTAGPAASDIGPSGFVMAQYSNAQVRLDSARADRRLLERLLAALPDTGKVVSDFESASVVSGSSALTAAFRELDRTQDSLRIMRRRYTETHPGVIGLRTEIGRLRGETMPALVRGMLDELLRRTAELSDQVASTADTLRTLPVRATDEARLLRKVSMATALYNTVQQQYDQARIALSTNVSDVRILDPATVLAVPSKYTPARILIATLLGGFGLGIAGALLRDRWDPRFRYPEQVSRDMGMTILGSVPHLRPGSEGTAAGAAFRDAIRGIRMNLAYAHGAAGPVAFTITSPGSIDGKSFVALHLARAFAQAGKRTVLIDGDVRRGTQHRRCHVDRKPGLTDYLNGELPLEFLVQGTAFPYVALVPSGTRMEEAPELLGSAAMGRLMGDLRTRFDVIICDSPPLSAGIDTYVLGAATGNAVLVIRPGVSQREMMQTKLEILGRMPIRLLGAVLNDVPDAPPYVYYAHYLPGYEAANERPPRPTTPRLPAGT